jgi:hypothetical protein
MHLQPNHQIGIGETIQASCKLWIPTVDGAAPSPMNSSGDYCESIHICRTDIRSFGVMDIASNPLLDDLGRLGKHWFQAVTASQDSFVTLLGSGDYSFWHPIHNVLDSSWRPNVAFVVVAEMMLFPSCALIHSDCGARNVPGRDACRHPGPDPTIS